MRNPFRTPVAGGIVLSVALTTTVWAQDAPRFNNLGKHHRTVTTSASEAQTWFDQGFNLYFGFNHEEAVRSFEAAAAEDPDCAMAYWGVAISLGPNINNPYMEEDQSQAAYDAVQEALARRDNANDVERDLIDAVATRYAWPAPEDRSALDQAYADAMAKVWEKHPDDADVGALYAESMMDLRPWDLWDQDGNPNPGTLRIVEVLEQTLKGAPMHPGANHFYIHTMEASPTPEKALPSANRMRDLVPDAGHLVHMPAHIDIRMGNYEGAIIANQKAIEADRKYAEATGGQTGFYTLYRAHNYHFLAYAAMFDGQRDLAVSAAREMIDQIPLEMVRAYPDFLDAFMSVPVHVLVRFGLWEDLIKEPEPPADLQAWTAMWYYGRTVAFSSLGQVEEAQKSFDGLKTAIAAIPDTRTLGNNPVSVLMEIGVRMAEGELEYRKGNYDRAFALLREAVDRDVALRYDEPWGWMQPVRHSLGALLLEQGHIDEAEQVYRADLKLHPGNGWALHGLHDCLERSGKTDAAEEIAKEFKKCWARSDIAINASCYCARGD